MDGGGVSRVFNHSAGNLAISGLTVQNGSASIHGGGIYSTAPLSLTECVVSGCVTSSGANSGGGAIFAQGGLTMDRCTVSGNRMQGGGYGGGLEISLVAGVLTNCTFSGNHAAGSGGGVEISNTTGTLVNCTITQNSVAASNPGGGIAVLNGTLALKNSIVAGNAGQAGQQIFLDAATLTDNGGNVTLGDPLVAPLADYGGPTPTHALLCGSPAMNIGVASYPATDQRSVARPQGSAADSGAFEANIFLSPGSLPGAQTDVAYNQSFTATGGTGPYTFSAIGTLPTGLSLAADGSLAGMPTALGSWTFTVMAEDSQGFGGVCNYTIAVSCGTVTVVNPAVTTGTVNASFSQTFTQTGGLAPVTFSTTSALPAGVTLASDGTLAGTPTVLGTFLITVTATDKNSCIGTGDTYTLHIEAGAPATLSTVGGTPQSTVVDTAFAQALQVEVLDGFGYPVSGATITFAAPGSGASAALSSTSASTDNAGHASVTATANTAPGLYQVTASVGTLTPVPFTLTNLAGAPATIGATSGTPQSATLGAPFAQPLQVRVLDAFGNPVSGVTVAFSAPGSGASAALSDTSATTDNPGHASVTAIANLVAGSYPVTASVAGLPPVSFNLDNHPAEPIPLLDQRGLIGLVALLLAVGAMMLKRN